MRLRPSSSGVLSALLLGALPVRVLGAAVLKTDGFSSCLTGSSITVNNVYIEYDNNAKVVTFDLSGSSSATQNVTASLDVEAYGISVYSNTFNPCDESISALCPVPSGSFAASGTQSVPVSYSDMIPSVAFSVPDIDATATLKLTSLDGNEEIACITSAVNNGKTVSLPAVSYVAAAVAAAALVGTGITAVGAAASGAGGSTGVGSASPSFADVIGVFQGFAMNGMNSVNYPTVYRSFAKNFGFSTGLIPWNSMQNSIDSFRKVTGGNLTDDNVTYLKNATLVFTQSDVSTSNSTRRALQYAALAARDSLSTSTGGTSVANETSTSTTSEVQALVSGIQAYAEELSVPQANTFMTVLLIVAIVMAAIAVGILLFKVILETWALFASFPEALTDFRKNYWRLMARVIVQLILVLYGIWVLYCIYQFTHGDSWAAKLLAGITLALFTGVLAFFTFRIWQLAMRYKKAEGDASMLYQDAETWEKYSLFYDNYRKDFWWVFIPTIVYSFAKGCVLAGLDGHGFAQTIAQLCIEGIMLIMLIWNRPFERRASNVINIFIQIVRALSVLCILIFVEELGIAKTTQTVTGVVLIAIQCTLSGVLGILIFANTLIACIKENPHVKARREAAEKKNQEFDDLTPLDARNSLLMDPVKMPMSTTFSADHKEPLGRTTSNNSYESANPYGRDAMPMQGVTSQRRSMLGLKSPTVQREESRENLVAGAAPLGGTGTEYRGYQY